MEQFAINLIVLGKSGAGKSSFCNYLFDKPGLFETGSGKPVTSWERNFQSHTFEHQGHLLNVFDSVGLEANNYELWIERFDSFMRDRRQRPIEPEAWIHGAFYIVNANSARLENVDISLIKRLGNVDKIPLQVILTNADAAGEKVEALTQEISKSCPGVLITPLCSVSVRMRGGKSSEPFGKNTVLSLYLQQSHSFLSKRLAAMSCLNFKQALLVMRDTVVDRIEKADLSLFKLTDLDLDKEIVLPDLDEIFSDLRSFDDYLSSFGFAGDWETSGEIEKAAAKAFDDFQQELEENFQDIQNRFDSDSLMSQVGALFDMVKIILTLKSTLIDWLEKGFERVFGELDRLFTKYVGSDDFFALHPMKLEESVRVKWLGIF